MGLTQVRGPIEIIWAVTVQRPLKRQRVRKKSGAAGQRQPPLSIGPRTWVSPIYQAPYAVMNLGFFENHKHTQQLLPINDNHLEQSNIRERKMGGCRWVS